MHSILVLGTLALAGAAMAAENCNPTYQVQSAGQCTSDCNQKAGQGLWSDWTSDPSSPNFIKSLSFNCAKGTPEYTSFMTSAGSCMMKCDKAEQDKYFAEFGQTCSWYQQHKDDACGAVTGGGNSNSTSSTDGAAKPDASKTGGDAKPDASKTDAPKDDAAKPSTTQGSAAGKLQIGGLFAVAAVGASLLLN
ncbi:uncharacterized protein BYT42DRAFT_608771 [Radiomyces spectabilis]|uniref:uncharacterized protein n=1 Tax=Radiomyces spectabilis TaxID=64574 RepID=UPI002220EC83|nr:uncharacterized protein BYT42DRAFT_608771 [Radiomyces spectabilis]KAI8365250.1 hypothetical protein BYT42DRAFT_608771 [Radiomyces spectabilis]